MAENFIIQDICNIVKEGNEQVDRLLSNCSTHIKTDQIVIPTNKGERLFSGEIGNYKKKNNYNRFICGDNIHIINALLHGSGCESMKGKIDFIYIDPPFLSKANYNAKISLPLRDKIIKIEKFAYSDTWKDGIISYLKMLYPRLVLMRELLSDRGSIYVHLDWHVVHYVKVLMDEIFGEDMFLNEIIWSYKSGGVSKKYYSRKHDTILLYSKTKNYIFNPQKEKSYNRGLRPYRFKGVDEYEDEIGWHTLVNAKDVWNIDMVGRTSKERVGYDTQKPEKLLERMILSSTNEDSIVADFFAGSGTTGVVAEKYNRSWILSDLGVTSNITTMKRLIEKDAKDFVIQSTISSNNSRLGKLEIKVDKKDEELINISLSGYHIDVSTIPIEEKYKDIVKQVLAENSLALIDFISIDTDYNGEVFISRWHDFRGREKLSITPEVQIKVNKKSKRKVFIKVVDVFGFYSEYKVEV